MLLGLPEEFPVKRLGEMSFGSADASTDELLEPCFCEVAPIRRILSDEYTIILGEKGVGKSAVFNMIDRGRLRLITDRGTLVLPIDERFQYQSIRESVLAQVKPYSKSQGFRHRVVWETFLLFRMLDFLNEQLGSSLPPDLAQAAKATKILLGGIDKPDFTDILENAKYDIDVEVELGATGTITPKMGVGVASGKPPHQKARSTEEYSLNADKYKRAINDFLRSQGVCLYILIDRLDDFTSDKNYDAQRTMLEGLLDCEMDYQRFDSIKLKIFLRKDLFERLMLPSGGKDKVLNRTTELTWDDEHIREFIARRILHNYRRLFEVDSFGFVTDEGELYFDDLNRSLFGEPPPNPAGRARSLHGLLTMWVPGPWLRVVEEKITRRGPSDAAEPVERTTNLTDQMSRAVITTLFPRKISHLDASGKNDLMDASKYFSTHFSLGSCKTTPRMVMWYMRLLLDKVQDYYEGNPDKRVLLNGADEYPLVRQQCIRSAYKELQREVTASITSVNVEWNKWLVRILEGRGDRATMSYSEMRGLVAEGKGVNERSFGQFIAFLTHVGFIECENADSHDMRERLFTLPVIFRAV
ncbi:MAG: hypothetical protein P4L93_09610 [Coriobacteriia bacterium]|nr:hypothetical protein [Coriobacteriia bacterium]